MNLNSLVILLLKSNSVDVANVGSMGPERRFVPIKPVKWRRSPREIIAAAKAIIEKKEMARCMESNDESFKFVNEAAKPVHIQSALSVRPVYIKRPWHASHHKGHTSLRSSYRWANN